MDQIQIICALTKGLVEHISGQGRGQLEVVVISYDEAVQSQTPAVLIQSVRFYNRVDRLAIWLLSGQP